MKEQNHVLTQCNDKNAKKWQTTKKKDKPRQTYLYARRNLASFLSDQQPKEMQPSG